MKHSNPSRFLSFVLALVMVFSMLPMTAFATDSATYTQITSAEELITGTIDPNQVQQLICGYQCTALVMKDGKRYQMNGAFYKEKQLREMISFLKEKSGVTPTGKLAEYAK